MRVAAKTDFFWVVEVVLNIHEPKPTACFRGQRFSPISILGGFRHRRLTAFVPVTLGSNSQGAVIDKGRSEEHTSELQSHSDLVCRLLLEKKKKNSTTT